MRRPVLSSILLFVLLVAGMTPTHADDFSADIAKVRDFLDSDKSYSPAKRAEAEAAFAKLQASASNMSRAAFQLAVAHIAALTHNGHTMLVSGGWMFEFNRIPLRAHVFADEMRIVHAPEAMRELVGARVVSIDGHSADALRQAFGQYFGAREGKRDEWVGFFIESPALLHAAGLAKESDRLDMQFELANGSKVTRTLQGLAVVPAERRQDFRADLRADVSAGISSAGYLKQAAPTQVTIVGEPMGDYLEFWAEGDFLLLPVSKGALLLATERHNYMTGCPEADCHRSIREHPIRVQSLEPDNRGAVDLRRRSRGTRPGARGRAQSPWEIAKRWTTLPISPF